MAAFLRITVCFLDKTFHGRSDREEPEWPPSPLRLFQALVAASAALNTKHDDLQEFAPALQWLEKQTPPLVVAPGYIIGEKCRLFVPNNVGDLVARAWSKGGNASMANYRTQKDVRPMRLQGGDAVYYLWPLAGPETDFAAVKDVLLTAARSITHLGWGIDMVVADASVISGDEVEKLPGQRWQPVEDDSGTALRVPRQGTLDDLIRKHTAFLNRVSAGTFRPVPPLSAFAVQSYRSDMKASRVPFAAFSLLKPDADNYRPFDPMRQGMHVAGMLRHLASQPDIAKALGWPQEKITRLVLGHAEAEGQPHEPVDGPRLAFLPLPGLEYRGGKGIVVGSIRRLLVTGLRGIPQKEVNQIAQLLSGRSLIDEKSQEPAAFLSRLPNSEKMVRDYTKEAVTWATVTPVVLPGYDDPKKYRRRLFAKDQAAVVTGDGESLDEPLKSDEQKQLLEKLDARTVHLLRKAIRQAGYSDELARNAEIEWRGSGYWPGTDLASRYAVPEKLRRFRRLHVRLTWRDAGGNPLPLPGPLCLGSGRFIGMGLFAPLP